MTSTHGLLFELLFSGAAIAFGVWQLISVRRAQREDDGRAEEQHMDGRGEDAHYTDKPAAEESPSP